MIDFLIDIAFATGRFERAMIYAPIGAIAGILAFLITQGFEKLFKRKANFIIVMIVLVVLFVRAPDIIRPWLQEHYPDKIAERENIAIAAEVNKTTPVKLDEVTTLSYAEGTRRGITYHYNLSLNSHDIEDAASFNSEMKAQVVPLACNNPDVMNLLQMGKIMSYSYYDASDSLITTFDIDQQICSHAGSVSE